MKSKINLELLKNKLIDSNYIDESIKFDIDALKKLLIDKFSSINYEDAKNDVLPFIKDTQKINIWNKDFFISITSELEYRADFLWASVLIMQRFP